MINKENTYSNNNGLREGDSQVSSTIKQQGSLLREDLYDVSYWVKIGVYNLMAITVINALAFIYMLIVSFNMYETIDMVKSRKVQAGTLDIISYDKVQAGTLDTIQYDKDMFPQGVIDCVNGYGNITILSNNDVYDFSIDKDISFEAYNKLSEEDRYAKCSFSYISAMIYLWKVQFESKLSEYSKFLPSELKDKFKNKFNKFMNDEYIVKSLAILDGLKVKWNKIDNNETYPNKMEDAYKEVFNAILHLKKSQRKFETIFSEMINEKLDQDTSTLKE